MFTKKISFLVLMLSFALVVGCSDGIRVSVDKEEEQNNQQQEQEQQNQQNQEENQNQNENDEQSIELQGKDAIQFINVNLQNGDPPLQTREGIFYFTKSKHPASMDRPEFEWDTHNGWLIQLDDAQYKGHQLKVQKIEKSGSIFDITVTPQPGGDVSKPGYGFFKVGIFDMPTTAQFRIYDDSGRKLWPGN